MRRWRRFVSRERILSLTLADLFLQTGLILATFWLLSQQQVKRLTAQLTSDDGVHKLYEQCKYDLEACGEGNNRCRQEIASLKGAYDSCITERRDLHQTVFADRPCACRGGECKVPADIIFAFTFALESDGIRVIEVGSEPVIATIAASIQVGEGTKVQVSEFAKRFSRFHEKGCKHYARVKDRDGAGTREDYKVAQGAIRALFQAPFRSSSSGR